MKLHQLLYLKNNVEEYADENGTTEDASVLLQYFREQFDQTYRLVDMILCGNDEVPSEIMQGFRPLYDLFREAHRVRTGIELGELE